MPKLVDHEERRQLIAEGVLRVMASRGLEAVSLRDVAADAEVSMGMVQHYFRSKDQMLQFACDYLLQQTREEISAQIIALGDDVDARARMRIIMSAIVPLDEPRADASRVWIAFLARAVVEPGLAAFLRNAWIGGHAFIAGEIRLAQSEGVIAEDFEAELEAMQVLSLSDGLVSHVLLGHYSYEQALAAIDGYLDRLFAR